MRVLNQLDKYGDTFPLVLADMKRYNNRIKIKSESIAEHSFFVAYNILKLGYDYKLSAEVVNEAVAMAITHDYPEAFTSDIPHDCKQSSPELKAILTTIELKFLREQMPELLERYRKLESEPDSFATLLVDLGDAISVLQYSNREIELGNRTEDMKIIHNEVCSRVTKLFSKLEEMIAMQDILKGNDNNVEE
jgi:putative hydrolase of HD superfamily